MNSFFRLFIPLAVLTMLSACSLPLKVTKVESMAEPVKGVRYFLKRPSYVAGLKIDFDKAEFFDYSKSCMLDPSSKSPCLTPEGAKEIAKKTKIAALTADYPKNTNPWIKGDQITNIRNIYCIKFPVPEETDELPIDITLQQRMEGNPILFEAKSRIAPPHWFADSESSITLDDNGYLTAIMAGEDDKSLEFIQAVAGLAVKAAGLFSTPSPVKAVPQCLLFGDDNFHTYVTKYIKLTSRRNNLQEKLNETYQKLELRDEHTNKSQSISAAKGSKSNNSHMSDTPEQMKLRFELMSLLKGEITSIDKDLEKLQYNLPTKDFVVNEVEKNEEGKKNAVVWEQKSKDSSPWITFTLTKE